MEIQDLEILLEELELALQRGEDSEYSGEKPLLARNSIDPPGEDRGID